MTQDPTDIPLDQQVADLLARYDEALAAGGVPSLRFSPDLPVELRDRLRRGLHTLGLLRQAFPGAAAAGGAAAVPAAAPAAAPADGAGPEPPFSRLGRFLIRREVGRGAHGMVFLAYDPQLGREVALKVPYGEALLNPDERARFVREARAAATFDHPNLLPIFEAGEVGPVCYSASAYCPGGTLADWLKARRKPVPGRTAARIVAALASAMQHAHDRGVLHRDLKPSNILLHEPHGTPAGGSGDTDAEFLFIPRVADFGTAKLQAVADAAGTLRGTILGTPSYMAPEQAQGHTEAIGPAADLYALGAILYELLTGRPPFQAETVLGLLEMVKSQAPAPPSWLQADVPPELDVVCLACLRKDPARRYPGAAALAEVLHCFLSGSPLPAPPADAEGAAVADSTPSPAADGAAAARRPGSIARGGLLLGLGAFLAALTAGGLFGPTALRRALGHGELHVETERAVQILLKQDGRWVRILDTDTSQSFELPGGDYEADIRAVPGGAPLASRAFHLAHGGSATLSVPPPVAVLREAHRFVGHPGEVWGLDVMPGGKEFAAGDKAGKVWLWDIASGARVQSLGEFPGVVMMLALVPPGRRRILSGGWGSRFGLWDLQTGQVERFFAGHKTDVFAVAVSPDGRRAVSEAYYDPAIRVWDVETGALLHDLVGHGAMGSGGIAFSPDGRTVLTGSYDNTMILWDAATGKDLRRFRGHSDVVFRVGFSSDGRRAVSGGDQTARVWDVTDGRELARFRHPGGVTAVCFSPDGARVLAGSHDGTLHLWDVAGGAELARCDEGHGGTVTAVAFLPDGRRWLSASRDRTVRLWELPGSH